MSLSLAAAALLLMGQVEAADSPTQPPPLQFPFADDRPATDRFAADRFTADDRQNDPLSNDGGDRSSSRLVESGEPTTADDGFSSGVRPTAGEEPARGRYGAATPAGGPTTPPGGWSGSEGGFSPAPRRPADASDRDADQLAPLAGGEMELSKKLLVELVRIPAAEQSDGQKIALDAALQQSTARAATVDAYWRLVLATADYQAAMADADRIAGWRPQAGRTDHGVDAAYEDALARRAEARADWLAARHDLARTSISPVIDKLPLSADLPHTGDYVLNFEKIFGSAASAPRAAVRGRDVIPARLEGVRKRAEQLQAAQQRITQFENAYGRGQLEAVQMIRGMEQLRAARSAFLRSVYIYNQEIAGYAFAVPGVSSHETLTSILIKREPQPGDARSVLQSTTVTPSTAEAAPATFIEPRPEPAAQLAPSLAPEPEPAGDAAAIPRLAPEPGFFATPPGTTAPVPNYPPPRQETPFQSTPALEPTPAD